MPTRTRRVLVSGVLYAGPLSILEAPTAEGTVIAHQIRMQVLHRSLLLAALFGYRLQPGRPAIRKWIKLTRSLWYFELPLRHRAADICEQYSGIGPSHGISPGSIDDPEMPASDYAQ